MKKIYVFGNEYLKEDKLSRGIAGFISQNYEIVHCRSPDELLEADDKEILILDVVKNIKEPVIINDIEKIKTRNIMSLHDFDLGFFLNLMKELGLNKKIKIIGVPTKGNSKEIARKVKACL